MNFFGPVISRGRTGANYVALTFDDGPSEPVTRRILDLLDQYGVKATFFVSGVNASRYPAIITEMIVRGHSIGNHSYSHFPLLMLQSYRSLYREIAGAQSVLRAMGVEALAFRPPVGIINPKLHVVLAKLDLVCVTFSCRARDAGNRRIKNLSFRILKKVRADDIILLHDVPAPKIENQEILLQEIEKILAGLQKKGLEIISLSDLINMELMRLESRP